MDKRYEHLIAQKAAQQKWESENTYSCENNPGPLYSIDTPPPTVSGSLHIGHIFSYTQTDMLARYQRMSGKSVFYPFGFDDNGLPTEKYVEQKLGVRAHELGRSAFIKLCLTETKLAGEQFKSLWQRIGLSCDWNQVYSTISDDVRKISQESFIRLFKQGSIYRKYEPALYCTTCRTSVAQAELDDLEMPSTFNTIIFKAQDGSDLKVATTRPELLPSCVALFYHPDDKRYQKLQGTKAIVPVFGFEVPILPDTSVAIDKGTGLVMCCTFGDKTDIHWFKLHKLPYKQSIGLDGKLTESSGILAGLKVKDARERILEELKSQGLLAEQKQITHSVNVHERCKKEIEYVMLSQWFLNILDHKQKFLDFGNQIEWYPAFMQTRYRDWVENLSWDWCLSRQRFFGIPFPVWHCADCNEIIVADINQLPVDPQEAKAPTACTKCKSTKLTPDTDVMDTWNTSSITPYICYGLFDRTAKSVFEAPGRKQFLPMSMRAQAHDIIRTWAFYTIIKSALHDNDIPWESTVISGHVLSDAQEKLSKSKSNAKLSPEKLLEDYPADAIRYWTASGSLGQDVAFSESQIKIGIRLMTKLWNAFWFTREHTAQVKNLQDAPKNLGMLNEWILHQATKTFTDYTKYLDKNEMSIALQHAEQFFWNDFCDNYLELVKDQLFNPDKYPHEQITATRWTLGIVGLRILQLFAPYLPFITEAIYEIVYEPLLKTKSLHQTRFANAQTPYTFEASSTVMADVLTIIGAVRKLKSEQQLSLKTELRELKIVGADTARTNALKEHVQLIKGVTQAQDIVFSAEPTETKLIQHGEAVSAIVAL
ncbi:MAG: valine--tRNA ligase [Candidatus Babeliales bacterium]